MSTVASCPERRDDLLDAYADHCAAVGLGAAEVVGRLTSAAKFLTDHRDLDTWMTRALPVRLADLERYPLAWPLVGFAVLSGRTRADFVACPRPNTQGGPSPVRPLQSTHKSSPCCARQRGD
jgi:hypothetical protein